MRQTPAMNRYSCSMVYCPLSPATSEIEVDRGRSEVRVELKDGWRDDIVYRVVLRPGVRDLFGTAPERIAGFVFIGTPAKPLEERPRPDLDAIVSNWAG